MINYLIDILLSINLSGRYACLEKTDTHLLLYIAIIIIIINYLKWRNTHSQVFAAAQTFHLL